MNVWRRGLDVLAELSVVGSYSRWGYALRAPSFAPLPRDVGGKVVAVTGATSGIGRAAALTLAAHGASVVAIGRDPAKLAALLQELSSSSSTSSSTSPPVHRTFCCDLADLAQVFSLAASLPRLDVLMHNAGLLVPTRTLGWHGEEAGFVVHVLAPYVLTRKLEERFAPSARVVWVTSGGMYTQHLDLERCRARTGDFDGVVAYAQQKRAQVLLNELFARRLARWGVRSNAMHPGWAETPGVDRGLPGFARVMRPLLRTAAEGADTAVWLAIGDVDDNGALFLDRVARRTEVMPGTHHTEADREALWAFCGELTGIA